MLVRYALRRPSYWKPAILLDSTHSGPSSANDHHLQDFGHTPRLGEINSPPSLPPVWGSRCPFYQPGPYLGCRYVAGVYGPGYLQIHHPLVSTLVAARQNHGSCFNPFPFLCEHHPCSHACVPSFLGCLSEPAIVASGGNYDASQAGCPCHPEGWQKDGFLGPLPIVWAL